MFQSFADHLVPPCFRKFKDRIIIQHDDTSPIFRTADQNGKNELKLSGGASVTDDGNKGKGLLLEWIQCTMAEYFM